MSKNRITLLGGSGFVGTELSCRLAEHFDEVVVVSRHPQRSRTLRILSNVHTIQANVHDQKELEAALEGSEVVVNLVGILNTAGSNSQYSFTGAHSDFTKQVLSTCNKLGIKRYLHMGALNADADKGSSEYLRTKGVAEIMVKSTKSLDWTIFQPSVIFGAEDSFFNRFAGLLTSLPIFPLACPDAKMAPVYVGDVADAMIESLHNPELIGQSIKLCGPKEYTLEELVEYTAKIAGLKRKIIRLPNGIAKLQARVMEFVPGKPFSTDNYLSLQTDSVCNGDCTPQPTSIDAIVPTYIGTTKGIHSRHQHRRTFARR